MWKFCPHISIYVITINVVTIRHNFSRIQLTTNSLCTGAACWVSYWCWGCQAFPYFGFHIKKLHLSLRKNSDKDLKLLTVKQIQYKVTYSYSSLISDGPRSRVQGLKGPVRGGSQSEWPRTVWESGYSYTYWPLTFIDIVLGQDWNRSPALPTTWSLSSDCYFISNTAPCL